MFFKIKPYASRSTSKRADKMLVAFRRLLVGLSLILAASSAIAEDSLTPFNASYDLYRDDKHVGESFFKVEKTAGRIGMQMITKPGGLYALFTSQRPVARSTMIRGRGDFRLSRVQIAIKSGVDPEEVADFDWQQSLLRVDRKRKQYQLPLSEAVYDYLSIHWLVAQLRLADANFYELKFYRKGRIRDSTLTRRGVETLEIGGKKTDTIVFEHNFKDSTRRLLYHHDINNLWLPVRIERTRKGKKKTVLLLKSVDTRD